MRMTEAEWADVQQALCVGELRATIDNLLVSRVPVKMHPRNRGIMDQAWDDGDQTVRLIIGEEIGWFIGMWEDSEVCEGLEHEGVLYVAVYQSGGGLVAVIVGEDLVSNGGGVTFRNMAEAKAYIQGRIAA